MNRWRIGVALFAMAIVSAASADEKKPSIEFKGKSLKSHFGSYPPGTNAIKIDGDSLHFTLTSASKKPEQVGRYSYVSIAGDFEVSANYEWTPVEVPKNGYGVSVGIAVETDNLVIALARGNFHGKGSTYVVTQGKRVDGKMQYNNEPWYAIKDPKKATRGQLVMRRDKSEIVLLTKDGKGELEERGRIPFSTETVRKVRFFADPGNASTNLDAKLTKVSIQAEEITTQIPTREMVDWGWWPTIGLCLIGVVGVGYLVERRFARTGENAES